MYTTYETLQYQFFGQPQDDYIIEIHLTGRRISFHSLLAGYTRVLAIFMWKQGINAYRRNESCISITHTPYIKWFNSQESSKEECVTEKAEMAGLVSTEQQFLT